MKKTTEFQKIEELINRINTINFIERIFLWKDVKNLNMEAAKELGSIEKITDAQIQESLLELKQEKIKLEARINELNNKEKESIKIITQYNSIKEKEQQEYQNNITALNKLRAQIDQDRQKIQDEREKEIAENYEKQKETWKKHEQNVETIIKNICKQNQIEYISKEKVEFKGKPDNTIKIAKQYIIFDAKSPFNDNLNNFPTYIRSQADQVEKYIKEKDVKKSIYLVVPQNTIEVINEYTLSRANYKVYIVTPDSLESIILTLKEVENYETLENLSPEERDKICEIIGRFAHSTKRKIEIDNYMNREFLDVLDSCNQLDKETKEKSINYEKSYKLNPNQDRVNKTIDLASLDQDITEIEHRKRIKDKKLLNKKKKL
ncbi:MAG: hypothetical protein PHU32_06015 [Candidatus ainarchaeum sp.]|nr:hypothetical protein [Candidatus ainarchaeum sp.]